MNSAIGTITAMLDLLTPDRMLLLVVSKTFSGASAFAPAPATTDAANATAPSAPPLLAERWYVHFFLSTARA